MKKFWRILKKILVAAALLSGSALFVVVLTSAMKHQSVLTCKALHVNIDYSSGISFLNEGDIASRINYLEGGDIVGKTISKIDFCSLEEDVQKNPYVDHAEIFADQQQCVTVNIVQRRPIMRVINNDGVSYYLGEKNERIPLSNNFTPHVTVALGDVEVHTDTKRDSTVQAALYHLEQYIDKDEFLSALVDQVFVHQDGSFELIPKTGGHTILFGNGDEDMEGKFDRLKTFYKEGLSKTGWDKYKCINLEFEGQVVCEKRDTTNAL